MLRVSSYDIQKEFIEWVHHNKSSTLSDKRLELAFRKNLADKFLSAKGTMKYNGILDSGGYFGISLKNYDTKNGLYLTDRNTKKIYKIDPNTNKVVKTYKSLTAVSGLLDNDMSHKVKNKVLHKGFLYSYNEP